MAINKVWIEEGCTACGLCSDICPEVFTLKDVATVNEGVNFSDYEELIKEAAESCPVEVIKYSE
ncbi:MAG: ferredoxin [Bacteroidales bacterium]